MKKLSIFLMMLCFACFGVANAQSLWSENFEGGSMPSGWTTDGSGSWSVATAVNSTHPSSAGEGTYCAQIKHGTSGAATKLITPEIDLSSVNSAELSFMHAQQSWAGDIDGLKVYYRTSSSGTWTQLVEYTDAYASWTTESGIVLPNLSSTYQIAFEYIDNYGYGLGIDDINIVRGASCPAPAGLAVTNNGTTATLTWSSDATQFDVAWSVNPNADPDDYIDPDFQISGTTGTMSSMALDTDYYFWVRANCSANDQSSWAGPVSVHIGYCVPAPSSVDNNGISNVTFGIGNNVVNNDTPKATYANYSSQIGAVQAGVEASIAITFKTGYTYNTYVWADLNNDLTFGANEVICYGESGSTNPTTLTLNFTIPATQTTGDYRMRIGSADSGLGSDPNAADPCYSSSYGCFQDYTLRVEAAPTCPIPSGLALTTDGSTMTATWDANPTALSYNININGNVTPNATTTNSYTWNVDLSTAYTVSVEANCAGGETSGYCNPVSFTTPDCIGGHTIEYTLTDSYGDGWNGASITFIEGCEQTSLTLSSGSSTSGTLTICANYFEFVWNTGSYDSECGFTFTEGGTTLFTKPSSVSDGLVLYSFGTPAFPKPTALTAGTPGYDNVDLSWTENGTATSWEICINGNESNLVPANTNVNFNLTGLQPDNSYSVKVRAVSGNDSSCWSDEVTVTTPEACAKPTGLTKSNITFTTADLSWTGTANSYVVEYGTWTQAGTDHTATATMTPYTFSLSGFSGKGTIAIRHYNVNDQFYLNVDDIVVRDANENIVYSENFESGSIPAIMSNIDLDGDGYVWGLANSSNMNVNGSYGVYSASWYEGTVLYPDNWLVISDITLGGSITFNACGQDASAAAENFAVYVIADNQFTQAYSGSSTSCQVTGLTEGTAYAWRVQGDCGQYLSNWAFSMFKTPDNLLIFATAGNWNDLSNWTDIDGNAATALPTVDNKVRIDAAATIPSGVVATAKSALLNDGSITIQKGGQLKQGGSVKVTMYKGIEGYGANYDAETNNNGNYYFISTPHNCSYFEQNTTFPYVLNVTDGEYDLYAFDPTQTLEWINYKNNPNHADFHTGNNTGLFFLKGYLYANEDDTDLEYIGTVSSSLNNILLTDLFTYNSASTDDWNGWRLVGNPYTCDAYISYVDGNGNALSADFYTMDNSNTYTLLSSSDALAPLTGAMVNFSATGTVQFASEAPAKANRTGMINMNLVKGNKTVDQARVRFGQGYNMQHMSFRNNSSIYMPVDNNEYAVVYTEEQGEMPVNFKAESNGSYTISFNTENVELGYLHLIDNMNGNDVDLLANPSYSFEAKTTDYESRFKLVFATGNNDDNFAFYSNGSFVINNEGNATLQVIDVNGRIMKSESIYGCSSIDMNAAQGIYMLRLINGDNVKVQKVVVR